MLVHYASLCFEIHSRFCRWNQKGVWERIFLVLAEDADNEYGMIDSTIVRAHQHSADALVGDKNEEAISKISASRRGRRL